LPVSLRSSLLKKWLMIAAKLLIVVLVAWFVRDTLIKAWRQIGEQTWQWQPIWLVLSGLIYIIGLLFAGLYWRRVLKVLGQDVSWTNALKAYYIGHLGKYVPGKAMVVVIRTMMVQEHRVNSLKGDSPIFVDTKIGTVPNPALTAASVFFETLTMMAVGAFLAAGILAVRASEHGLLFWGAIGLMIVSGLPVLPPIFRILARMVGIGKSDPAAAAALSRLGWRTLLEGWFCMIIVWMFMAASLWATFRAMGVQNIGLLEYGPEYIAAVSLSMVAGFLSLVPAGLGVRDLVLVELLVKLFAVSDATATVAGGLLRLIWLVSELIISGILYFRVGSK
jgi:glycosyltransferase 2 family protein